MVGMMDDDEDLMQPGAPMPNVPRDPEKEARMRDKLKAFLQPRMAPDHAAENALAKSDSDLALINLFQQAANQAGTIGGKAASSAPLQEFTNRQMQGNQVQRQQIAQDRARMANDENNQMKLLQYFQKVDDDARRQRASDIYRDKTMALKERAVGAQEKAANAKEQKESGQNEGMKALDRDYAKDYNDWTSKNRVNALSSIDRLEKIQKQLEAESGKMFGEGGGSIRSTLPDALRSERSIELRDDTKSAANATLKELFGGQLSDSERAAAASEFYNDKLDSASNAKRLKAKIQEMKDRLTEQDAKAEFFRKNQTLAGYQGTPITTKPPAPDSRALSPKDQEALDWADANPNDPRAAKIRQKLGR